MKVFSHQDDSERYRRLFNSIDQGFCVLEVLFDAAGSPEDYRFLEVNPVFEEMTGIPNREALSGKTVRQIIPELEFKWIEMYGRIASTGEAQRFVEHSEVMNRWFNVYAFRLGDEDSRQVALIFTDISKQRIAEEELRNSDTRLRLALDISRISTFEIDLETNAVKTDEIGREIYGFEEDEPLDFSKIQSHFHPDDYGHVLHEVTRSFAPDGPGGFEIEQRIVRTDGDIRWIRVRGRAIFEGDGDERHAVTCIGTYIDITSHKLEEQERERLAEQLEAERSRLRYLFTSAPAFVATLRGPEHVFELTNTGYMQLIGHRNVVGKALREALPEVESQGFIEILDNVYSSGKPFIGQEIAINIQAEPGQSLVERILNFVYQPIFEPDGSVSGIFVHGVDVTEQVEGRQEAEAANRAKDEFLATLSHELRTPLNSILGWSQMLKEKKLDEATRERAIETIQRNTRLQSQLIDDILDVSRIISGKLRLDVRTTELSPIVNAAVETVAPSAVAKKISLGIALDRDSNLITGDPARLQQVIWNLLSNAIKFTPEGGHVQLSTEHTGTHVQIIVTDTGIGISPEVLPHIFERFRQGNAAITRAHGGLGLGLAIVRHLVEMHGGTVTVNSDGDGRGSVFTVDLPLISPAQPQAAETEYQFETDAATNVFDKLALQDLKVLVVEDEEDGRALIRMILEESGAQVTAVASAAEALSAVRELRPDILLSDIGMPYEDGFSLIQKVRELPAHEGGQTPAAALTAYAGSDVRLRVLRSGFQIYVTKPIEPGELVAVVMNLAGRFHGQ